MPATPFDSAHLSALFNAGEAARLFSDSAEIRAMMLVEGALAEAQGAAGVIPETAAAAIRRASLECQIDPVGLATNVGQNGVTVPGLVAAFREAMQAPEHAQYLHWGATSQDIQDTGLMLRLRQAVSLASDRLDHILQRLAALADSHAETPMAARTYAQHATPTSFGAVVAGWGWPLLEAKQALGPLKRDCLLVSLSGAAGTGSALGPDPAGLRQALALGLGLGDPHRSWHNDRTPVLGIAGWFTRIALALGSLGEDLLLATQSGIAELRLGGSGGSSTMPQKQNPVAPSVLVALARHVQGLNGTLQGASIHRQQRDGTAWFTEWLTLPQLVLSTCAALETASAMLDGLEPDSTAMRATLDATGGLILAEALSFALAQTMPRPEAQAAAKRLCTGARESGTALETLARARHPDLPSDLFDWTAQMGQAPADARAFATTLRDLQ